ncbi:MAG TPA: SulP family inorganic anion transporter [Xanthobacteraceae bacterium]|nr:SulP family inorganic anion transporter [Xanthobacteraceae bacterium]
MTDRWPVFRTLRGFSPTDLDRDLIAGLTLAAIAIPEQMATARLGGFAPQVGFFAFVAGTLGFAALGSSRVLSVGADSTITPIFAGSLALIATSGSPQYIALAGALALMVGVILILAGLIRFGWIADLLSEPVITGFLAGISVHIVVSQAPAVLGFPGGSGSFSERAMGILAHLGQTNPLALALGLGVLLVTLICERISARIPGALIGLAVATAAVMVFGLEKHGVAVLGEVPSGLPRPALPAIDFTQVYRIVPLAIVISLVVMMQTAVTTRSFPPADELPDVDRDFIGAGAGSLLAGFVGTFPVNTSPPRTAITADVGARSQAAGLIAVAIVLALASVGTALLAHVPEAALGGMLLFVAQRIFRWSTFVDVFRRAPGEFALIVATMAAIVVLPIQTGVVIGIFLSLLHGVFITTRTVPIEFERVPGTTIWWPPHPSLKGEKVDGVLVMAFQAPLSFLNAYDFRHGLTDAVAQKKKGVLRLVVLEASSIAAIDYTAAAVLCDVIRQCRDEGADFAVARLESLRAQESFDAFGLTQLLGADHIFRSVEEAVREIGRKPNE